MKKNIRLVLALIMLTIFFTGCAGGGSNDIVVVSREDGSGTRGAFIELFGIEEKDANGNKIDHTTDEATVVNSTSIVMTTVAGNKNSIGYISLGSLNDTVKAVKIDGTEPTVENIKNNAYKVFRPFNIATKEDLSELAQDFIRFILSNDGQKVVEDNGYIASSEERPYSGTKPSGKIVVAGSSSVTPVMEKLKEAYLKLNTNAEIEIQLSDSTTGMNSAMGGTCDIGMASRELKESELKSLKPTVIAMDGLAVVVNKENTIDNITSEQIKGIFKGEIISWDEITE
ncbi:MAG: phosphate ABC transporter substrate-binding protein [Clostridiaceae bacterium]|nr:phosphate ABC transporter substrate-binding protein [Clostridiaceae bacterium]